MPSFSLGLDFHYINNFALYSGLCLSLGTRLHVPLKKSTRVRVEKELPKGTMLGIGSIEFGSPKYINKLGVLYAKYELTDKALVQFNKILKTREYYPALINMGNIYLFKGANGEGPYLL